MDEDTTSRFALVGNRPALDFANTVHARRRNLDALQQPSDLFDLLGELGLFPEQGLARFRVAADSDAEAARQFLDRALSFRRQLREWLAEAPKPPAPEHPLVEAINLILAAGAARDVLLIDGTGWVLRPAPLSDTLALALVPIARSAAELVAEGADAPIRKCGNPRCPLYFYDTSRNRLRRWCSMESCGNQAKARAHLARRGQVHAAE